MSSSSSATRVLLVRAFRTGRYENGCSVSLVLVRKSWCVKWELDAKRMVRTASSFLVGFRAYNVRRAQDAELKFVAGFWLV